MEAHFVDIDVPSQAVFQVAGLNCSVILHFVTNMSHS
jgi:hypothetical protein